MSVVEGAAYFGITDNYIKARILKYSYGFRWNDRISLAKKNGISSEYISNNKSYREYNNEWRVKRCFKVIARKNDEIYTGQIKKTTTSRKRNTAKRVTIPIMWSKMEYPKVETDGHLLGKVTTYFDNEDKDDRHLTTEFHFYDTLIKAVKYRTKAPEDKQIRYITNVK
eukprot:389578_1